MASYATKSYLKNSRGVNTPQFTTKTNLASLISDIDELDIDKLEKIPSGLNSS